MGIISAYYMLYLYNVAMATQKLSELTILQPDDWHLHLRDGNMMQTVAPFSAKIFKRAIIMPNLVPPITTVEQCRAYRDRIIAIVPEFEPLMTLYLTDDMPAQTIKDAASCGFIHGVKLYPKGVTTHSAQGVTSIKAMYHILEAMQQFDMPLLVHGESTDASLDIYDREKHFIENSLITIRKQFPELRTVFEHITTNDAVQYVEDNDEHVAATITPHHLLFTRSALFDGGLRPHHYCLPLPQREKHRVALVQAACSGQKCFFLGTDSAPHARSEKENACGCAGIFNAPVAMGIYAQIFEENQQLNKLEQFAGINGPHFYKLPTNKKRIKLVKKTEYVADTIGDGEIIPLLAGQNLEWSIENE